MTNIEYHLPQEIRQEFRINEQGQAFVSIRGAARLLGLSHTTLVENLNSARSENCSKMAQGLIEKGFQVVTFSDTGIPDTAFIVICEYYAFEAGKRCTEQAKLVYRAFAAVGFRTWVQQELGWSVGFQKPMTLTEVVAAQSQILVQQEQQIAALTDEATKQQHKLDSLEMNLGSLAKTTTLLAVHKHYSRQQLDQLQKTVDLMLLQQAAAVEELSSLPDTVEPPVEMTTRAKVVRLVRSFCRSSFTGYRETFNALYQELKYRYSYDVKARCRKSQAKYLDQLERDGQIDNLYAIALDFVKRNRRGV